MKSKILDLAKSYGLLFLIFIRGVIGFRISFSLGTPHEKEEFNIKIDVRDIIESNFDSINKLATYIKSRVSE